MGKKIIIATLFLALGIQPGADQDSGITIHVVSAEDGEPIIGASVLVEGSKGGGLIDTEGKLKFGSVPVTAK